MILFLLACDGDEPAAPTAVPPAAKPAEACTFLTLNDTYRIEPNADGTGGMARVRSLRTTTEARYGAVALLHAGDFLSPSLMSRAYKGAQAVEVFGALDGDAAAMDDRMWVVFGNHEFDASKMADGVALDGFVGTSGFHWLGTNITFGAGADGAPIVADPKLTASGRFDCGGIAVGIFGVTTGKKKPEFVAGFGDPVETSRAAIAALRADGAELVVGLTHQTVEEDMALLRALGAAGPDLVVGGHEHNQIREQVDGRPIFKADANAATAWRVTLRRGADGAFARDEELVKLDAGVAEDATVKALVDHWIVKNDKDFCEPKGQPTGCLDATVGTSKVPLVGAELEIRRFETNLGNHVADVARGAWPDAQIALVNSGSLRLNRDLAAGPIRRADIEELFAYAMPLTRLEIDGATLAKVLARATEEWTGNGHWLQVSGVAWAHDPKAGTATRMTLLSTGKAIAPADRLVVVVPTYMVTGDDGYATILPSAPKGPAGPDLKERMLAALAAAPDGISPTVEGRICNRPGPCLAVSE